LRIGFDPLFLRVTDKNGEEISSLTPYRNDPSGYFDGAVNNEVDNIVGRIRYDVLFEDNSGETTKLAKLEVPVTVVEIYFKSIKIGWAEIYFEIGNCKIIYFSPPDYDSSSIEENPLLSDLYFYIKDVIPPVSQILPLSPIQTSTTFEIKWTGEDENGSGIKYYDIQYKKDTSGDWIDWKTNFTKTSDFFTGEPGNKYYFRCRAIDWEGNKEAWPDTPDTFTEISKYTISQDNTLAIAAFPNPGIPDNIFVVVSAKNSNFSNLSVKIKQNGMEEKNLSLNKISNLEYVGSYLIDKNYPGKAEIKATYTTDGIEKEVVTYFKILTAGKSSGYLEEGRFKLFYEQETFEDGTTILLIPNIISSFGKELPEELVGEKIIYYLNSDTLPKKDLKISFNFEDIENPEKLGIYTYENNSYKYLGGNFDKEGKTISINTGKFTNYLLLADIKEPQISEIKIFENKISAKIVDCGSGININSLKLKINEKEVKPYYDEEKNEIKYIHSKNFEGTQKVSLEVEDRVKNKLSFFKVFQLPEEIKIENLYAFPNPYMGNIKEGVKPQKLKYVSSGIKFKYKTSGDVKKVFLEIFNIKGKLLDKIFDEEIDGEIDYNPVDRLANGVYIYRITVSDGKKIVSKKGKIVILK
jgi:hypothetical protein